jgi:hypothetical protein
MEIVPTDSTKNGRSHVTTLQGSIKTWGNNSPNTKGSFPPPRVSLFDNAYTPSAENSTENKGYSIATHITSLTSNDEIDGLSTCCRSSLSWRYRSNPGGEEGCNDCLWPCALLLSELRHRQQNTSVIIVLEL